MIQPAQTAHSFRLIFFDPAGRWVCLSAPNEKLAAPLHDLSFPARSVFFVFARLPGGRDATLAYFKQLAEMKIPLFVRMEEPGWPQPMTVWNPKVPHFPSRNRIRISSEDELCPTAMANFALHRLPKVFRFATTPTFRTSTRWRHAMSISRGAFKTPSEVELSRTLLFSGQHSGLRGIIVSDEPFLIFPAMSQGLDVFEDRRIPERAYSPFVQCTSCHLRPWHSIHDELFVPRKPKRRAGAQPASCGNHAKRGSKKSIGMGSNAAKMERFASAYYGARAVALDTEASLIAGNSSRSTCILIYGSAIRFLPK